MVHISINRNSSEPLYQQLANKLQKGIDSGKWKPGERLPSESELERDYKIGRASIKRAIAELAKKGLVYSLQGKGTFVQEPQMEKGFFRLTSFTEDMLSRGIEPKNRLVELQIIPAAPDLAQLLGLEPGEKIIRLCRLRLANQEPIILETSFLPYRLCQQILDENLSTCSLYQLLLDKCGVLLRTAKDALEPVLLSKEESSLLEAPEGSPAIKMERLTFSGDNTPVEFCTALIRGDKCRFYFALVSNSQN